MDLIPPVLIIARYFAEEQAIIDTLQTAQETAAQALDEFVAEHIGEDGLLAEATTDKGGITKSSVQARLKALTPDLTMLHETQDDNDDECDALEYCLSLIEAKSKADKTVKDAQLALDQQVLARYARLDEYDVQTLVIADKWFASLQAAIEGEVQRLTQALTERVKELEERYAERLPDLEQEVETFSARVAGHLKSMGME